jgi:hypothetical protein
VECRVGNKEAAWEDVQHLVWDGDGSCMRCCLSRLVRKRRGTPGWFLAEVWAFAFGGKGKRDLDLTPKFPWKNTMDGIKV